MSAFSLTGMGLKTSRDNLSAFERFVLYVLALIPGRIREKVLFSGARTDVLLQKAIQFCLKGPKPVQFRFMVGPLSGFFFGCETSHKYFLLGADFERPLQNRLAGLVQANDVVYDIGAHYGWWALWFSAVCRDVVAFEPSDTNFRILKSNIELNHRPNVILRNVALSDREASVPFAEDGGRSHLLTKEQGQSAHSRVQTVPMDTLADLPPPTFVKIDVEGHAGAVLEGMRRTLNRYAPVVSCEMHDSEEEHQVQNILESCGYRVENRDKYNSFPKWMLAKRQNSGE